MKFKKASPILVFLTLVILILFKLPISAEAAVSSRIYYTTDSEITVGQDFNIYVNADNLTDLYGHQIDFSFDPTLIQVNSIQAGSFYNNKVANVDYMLATNATKTPGHFSESLVLLGSKYQNGLNIPVGSQLFVIKAHALKAGTISLKTVTSSSTLSATGNNVCAKLVDSSGHPIAYNATNSTITIHSISINSFVANKVSPQLAGTALTLTANASGASGIIYRFHVFNGSTWSIVQNFSTNNKLTWTPTKPGTYRFSVNVKKSTDPDSAVIYKTIDNFVIKTNSSPVINSFVSNKTSPSLTGIPLTLTALASGTSVVYRFHVFNGSTWSIVQNFSTNNKLTWTPTKPGTYRFSVNVKKSTDPDSAVIYKTIDNYVVKTNSSTVINSFVSNKTSPSLTGIPLTLTALASGPSVVYRFHVFNGSTWSIVQNFSTNNKLTWTPTKPGTYRFSVNVKKSTDPDSAVIYKTIDNYVVKTNSSTVINSFVSNKTSPSLTGIPLTLTALASGPSVVYRFHVFNGSTWSIVQNFSTNNKLTWTPTKPGTYRFSVNVKKSTDPDSAVIYKTIDNFVVKPSVVINSFVANKVSPQLAGTALTLTANASGASVVYRFHVFNGSSWSIVQNFSTNNKLTWTPTKPGTYRFSVNVKRSTDPDSAVIYKTIDSFVIK